MPEFKFQEPPYENSLLDSKMKHLISDGWREWLNDLVGIQNKIEVYRVALDPNNVPANSTIGQTFTITSVIDDNGTTIPVRSEDVIIGEGDIVLALEKPTHHTDLFVSSARYAGTTNQLFVQFTNTSGSGTNAGSETYKLVLLKGL